MVNASNTIIKKYSRSLNWICRFNIIKVKNYSVNYVFDITLQMFVMFAKSFILFIDCLINGTSFTE